MLIHSSNIRPSALSRLLACSGSGLHEPGEDTTSAAAHEGTVAHHVSALCLLTEADPRRYRNREIEGVAIAGDLYDCIVTYVEYIRQRVAEGCKLYIEKRVGIPSLLLPDGSPLEGTADAILIHPKPVKDEPILEIVDLKTGQGHYVESDDPQIRYYGRASVETFIPEWMEKKDRKRVRTTIVQPRHYLNTKPVRSSTFSRKEIDSIRLEVMDLLSQYSLARSADDLTFMPGDQCTFCPLRPCAKLTHVATMPIRKPASTESMSQAEQMALVRHMKAWIKATESRTTDMLQANESVPGWDYAPGVGNRTWRDEANATEQLVERGYVLETIAPRVLLSPTQFEQAVGKLPDDLKALVHRPASDPRLVSVDAETAAKLEEQVFKAMASL